MTTSVAHLALVAAVSSALAVAACGGAGGGAGGPQAPVPGGPAASAAPSASGSAVAASVTPSASATGAAASPARPMQPVVATTMAEDLKALGLDAANLPPLDKVQPDKLRKVMKTFSKALGTKCTGCHDANDFRAPTPNKKVATRMWNDFVRGMSLNGEGALYCDSCHHGATEFLDRHDDKALSHWMEENFVAKLKSANANAKEMECETCHGDPFEGDFLDAWAKR